jgi:hypothetical protein
VHDRQRTGEIGDEDERGFQGGDQDRLSALVVEGDLGSELLDPALNVLPREVDPADPWIGGYEARSSLYRRARRSMSRR